MMRLQLELRQTLGMRQIQLIPGADEICLSGDPQDLRTLLRGEPQLRDGALQYALGGGWAVELLTGQQRPHHDLDVLQMNDSRLGFTLDNQSARSYFQALSFKPEEIVDKYVRKIVWVPKDESGEPEPAIDVYVLDPRFLLVSKLVGFARAPREKDLQDVRALAEILQFERSLGAFEDLLKHIPFLDASFRANRPLLVDLLSADSPATKRESVTKLAARFLQRIVEQFPADPVAGEQNARQFVSVLTKVYQDGLKNSFTPRDLGIRVDLLDTSITSGALQGFWQTLESGNELRVFMQEGAAAEIHRLRLMQDASIRLGHGVEDLKPLVNSMWQGRLAPPFQETTVILKERLDEVPLLCRRFIPIGKVGSYAATRVTSMSDLRTGADSRRVTVLDAEGTFAMEIDAPYSNTLRLDSGPGENNSRILSRDVIDLIALQLLSEGRVEDYFRYELLLGDEFSAWCGPTHDFLKSGFQTVLAQSNEELMETRAKEIFDPLIPLLTKLQARGQKAVAVKSVEYPAKYDVATVKNAFEAIAKVAGFDSIPLFVETCAAAYKSTVVGRREWGIQLAKMLPPEIFKKVREEFIRMDAEVGMDKWSLERANEYYALEGRELTKARRKFAAADMGRVMHALGYLDAEPDRKAIALYLRRSMEFCGRTRDRGVAPEPHYYNSEERWALIESIASELGEQERSFICKCRERADTYYNENK